MRSAGKILFGRPANSNFMRNTPLRTNRNAVESADDQESKRLPAVILETAPASLAVGESASARIRQAQDVLRTLLLDDDLEGEKSFLSGSIAVRLDRLQLELGQLAGLQTLFELWSKV